jgi:uncharacterized iron-regulated membrane protein
VRSVALFVHIDAKEGEPLADARSDDYAPLADAPGKHERIHAAQHGRERADPRGRPPA